MEKKNSAEKDGNKEKMEKQNSAEMDRRGKWR